MAHDAISGNDEIYQLKNRISELEQMLADCERDYRQQVDKAVELHKEVEELTKRMVGRPTPLALI